MTPDERMMELEVIGQYLERLQSQITRMQESLAELAGVMGSLADLESLKTPTEGLFPFANGIFVQGMLSSSQSLLVNVGQGVVVEKSITDVRALLDKQKVEIHTALEQAENQFDALAARAKELQDAIEKV